MSSPGGYNTTYFITNTEPTSHQTFSNPPRRGGGGGGGNSNIKSPISPLTSTMDSSDDNDSISSRPLSGYGQNSPSSPANHTMFSRNGGEFTTGSVLSQDVPSSSGVGGSGYYGVTSFQDLSDLQIDDSNNNHFFSSSSSSASPKLVMPKVALPSRRPFTENGLKLGKLKILVAGGEDVGKTSLINAISQTCKDLVYVEEGEGRNDSDSGVNEIYASTKPCPVFWMMNSDRKQTEEEEETIPVGDTTSSTGEKRRPSLIHSASSVRSDEIALDRNICFVDTKTNGDDGNNNDELLSYLDKRFRETANIINISYAQVVNLLTSAASLSEFSHADVCLYIIDKHLSQYDIDSISELSNYTPVIPVISKSDTMTLEQVLDAKVSILQELDRAGIDPFLFDTKIKEAIRYGEKTPLTSFGLNLAPADKMEFHNPILFPCAVSSIESSEPEMVASILMSPDYMPKLEDSELVTLCSYVFSEHGSSWLRYISAKKFLDWTIKFQSTNAGLNFTTNLNNNHNNTTSLVPYSTNENNKPVEESEYVINLPSSVFKSNSGNYSQLTKKAKDRAQQQTAKWAMQLEQNTRSENVSALRANSAALKRNSHRGSGGGVSKARNGDNNISRRLNLSNSVSNLDPLGLKNIARKAFNYTMKALGLLLSIRLVSFIYSRALIFCKVPTEQQISVINEYRDTSSLVSLMNSLGL